MARRPQQQQVRPAGAQAPVQGHHLGLFAFVGTGRHPHRAWRAQGRGERGAETVQPLRHGHVVLEVAQHLDLVGACTQLLEAPRIGGRLRGHARHRAQCAPDQGPQQPVAAQRARRQPRIEDVHRNALVAAAEQHVRPQLGFHDQGQAGLEVPQEAGGAAGQVIGQVDVVDPLAPQRTHPVRAGRGDGGDHPADVRPLLEQRVHQWRGRIDLAHGHRVQPHAGAAALGAVAGVAFVPAPEILAHPETTRDQVVQRQRREQVQGQRVQRAQCAFERFLAHGVAGHGAQHSPGHGPRLGAGRRIGT